MMGVARGERGKSAQVSPVSGMERAASRTTPDMIFFGSTASILFPPGPRVAEKNHVRHRRWRGRFAVLDPARSMPGPTSCLSGSGGDDDTRTAYRRTARRACEHHGRQGIAADRGRVEGCAGEAGTTRLTGGGSGADSASLPAFFMFAQGAGEGIGGRRGRKARSKHWRHALRAPRHKFLSAHPF